MARLKFIRTPEPIYVSTAYEAKNWAQYFEELPEFGYDTETNGLHPIRTRVKFFSVADEDNRICVPVRLLEHFRSPLERDDIAKAMSFARVDLHWTYNHGVLIRGPIHDTVDMDWLFDENRQSHGLKDTAKTHLRLRMRPFKEVFGSVGTTDKEVETLCRMHTALERGDEDLALELLVLVGHVSGSVDVLDALKRVYLSKAAGYTRKIRPTLLKYARDYGLAPMTRSKLGYVNDVLSFVSGEGDLELDVSERADSVDLLLDKHVVRDFHELLIEGLRGKINLESVGDPLEMVRLLVGDYASLDSWASYMLAFRFYPNELAATEIDDNVEDGSEEPYTLYDLHLDDRVPFIKTLWNMERRGVAVDLEAAGELERPMREELGRLSRKIVGIAGKVINPDSSPDLRAQLFTETESGWLDPFGNEPRKMTSGGASGNKLPSTDKNTLQSFADRGEPLSAAVLEYRKIKKLHGTYVVNVESWVDHRSRVHSTLKSDGTVSGRLSSKDPNLQNIPARGEMGPRIRKLFVAGLWGDVSPDICLDELVGVPVPDLPDDHPMSLFVGDYAQLEMRVMAHFSEDPNMIEAIERGQDLHCATGHHAAKYIREAGLAKKAFNYDDLLAAKKAIEDGSTDPRDRELYDVRQAMKAVGFGLLYGIGAVKLGHQLGLPVTETVSRRTGRVFFKCELAEKLMSAYFSAYQGVERFINDTHAFVQEHLFVETLTGRRRRLPDAISTERGLRAQALRQSVNTIIQGTAADITNRAMLDIERDEQLRRAGNRMLLQVHDELMNEFPQGEKYQTVVCTRVPRLMENAYDLRVPLHVTFDVAHSWGEAK